MTPFSLVACVNDHKCEGLTYTASPLLHALRASSLWCAAAEEKGPMMMMVILFLLLAATHAVDQEHEFEVAFENATVDECRIILKAVELPKLFSKQTSVFLSFMVRKEESEYKKIKVIILRGEDADNPSWQGIIPDALLMDTPGRTLEKVAEELNGARAVWTINEFGNFKYTVFGMTSEKTKKWSTVRDINWRKIEAKDLQKLKKIGKF